MITIRYHGARPSACAPTPISKMGLPTVTPRAGADALTSADAFHKRVGDRLIPPTRETPLVVDADLPAIALGYI